MSASRNLIDILNQYPKNNFWGVHYTMEHSMRFLRDINVFIVARKIKIRH